MVVVMMSAFGANFLIVSKLFHSVVQRAFLFHSISQLSTCKLIPGSGNNYSFFVMLTEKLNACINFLLGNSVGVAEDNATCIFYLVVVKLTKVFHIHFAFVCICYGCERAKLCTVVGYALHSADNITELAYTGGLN